MTRKQIENIQSRLINSEEGPWFVTADELGRVIAAIEAESHGLQACNSPDQTLQHQQAKDENQTSTSHPA
jgi:hypothetical protein